MFDARFIVWLLHSLFEAVPLPTEAAKKECRVVNIGVFVFCPEEENSGASAAICFKVALMHGFPSPCEQVFCLRILIDPGPLISNQQAPNFGDALEDIEVVNHRPGSALRTRKVGPT